MEKAGQRIGGILCKYDHWAGNICGRQNCLLCYTKEQTGDNLYQRCTKMNLVYETWCQTCKNEAEEKAIEKGTDVKKIKQQNQHY